MKSANRFLLTAIFVSLFAFNSQSQKSADKYTDYDFGFYLKYYRKMDSAFLMFNRYVNNADDSFKKAKAYRYMGEIQSHIGDLYGAEESLTIAVHTLDPLNKEHHEHLGSVYNTLGNLNLDLKQYDKAIEQYDKAKTFLEDIGYLAEVMNGKATALQKKGNYHKAIATYDSALILKPADQLLVARIIDNRARARWLQDASYPALPEFRSALKIRVDSQFTIGLNASYAHLSDYYTKSNADSALWYANKMHETARGNQSPDDILEAIDKIIRLNKSPVIKQQWYEEYRILNDSLQFSRDTTRNRFAMIKYDFQKSKAENLELNFTVEKTKAHNLTLQHDNTRQRLLLYGFIALAIAIITLLWLWYDKRKKRIRQESENAIRDSKLKTSQKIHDVVANGLYGIMNELEHNKAIETEPLLNKIEGLYEKSRNISYEDIAGDSGVDYVNQVHHLLSAFDNEQTKLIIVGNEHVFWNNVSRPQKQELQLILNEVMINMKKHSRAKNVVIVFKQEYNKALINYKDDGVGFNADAKFGNGMNNTVSRIKSINGEVNFGKSEKGGLSIAISFPLQSSKI